MTGHVADLSWKSGACAIEKLDQLRPTLAFLALIIKSTKVDYGSECVNIRQTAAKFVPCLLNGEQKPGHFSVYKDLQDQAKKSETPFWGHERN